jgi:hypothetical protein
MKSKDLLELKKLKQEIALIREQKDSIGHSLEWYKESKEVIEKQYNLLKSQLKWNEKRMKEGEKKIETIVSQYGMAGCKYEMCHEIKFKNEMKYIEWDNDKFKGNEYFCNEEHYEKEEKIRRHYGKN